MITMDSDWFELFSRGCLTKHSRQSLVSSWHGEGVFDFFHNDITVTIPFNFINDAGNKVGNKVGNKTEENGLNDSQIKVLAEIRNNPNITKKELAVVCHLGRTSIDNAVAVLRKRGYIERVGSNRSRYWKTN